MRTVQTWTIMENEMLVLDHMGLVWYVARKYRNTGYDLEDLAQEGAIGLIKAAGSFDPSRGCAYSTYAAKCIEFEILMYLRREKKHRTNSISLDQKMDVGGSEISIRDLVGREDPEIEMVCEKEALRQRISELDPEDAKLIWMYYVQEMTQVKIARRLGIGQSQVSRRLKKIMIRIRNSQGMD